MLKRSRHLLGLAMLMAWPLAHATAQDRRLDFIITVEGDQSWRNVLQWSKGNTTQRYELSTVLRSDGRLYPENLLDEDQHKRMAIREEYLTRRGLEELKRLNGGKLPPPGMALKKFSEAAPNEMMSCQGDDLCTGPLAERFAALAALERNSIEDLEAYLKEGENIPNGRYLYFFGYPGCPTTIHITNQSHIEGMQAFDRKKEKLIPFKTDRVADSRGTPHEQTALCRRYVVTIDTKTQEMFVENAFIPSPVGTTRLKLGETVTTKEGPLPIPVQVLDWTSAVVRHTTDSGTQSVTLPFTRPLDGNASVLGDFTGTLKISMNWSFKALQAPIK